MTTDKQSLEERVAREAAALDVDKVVMFVIAEKARVFRDYPNMPEVSADRPDIKDEVMMRLAREVIAGRAAIAAIHDQDGRQISDATRRMEKTLGAKFVMHDQDGLTDLARESRKLTDAKTMLLREAVERRSQKQVLREALYRWRDRQGLDTITYRFVTAAIEEAMARFQQGETLDEQS